MDKKPATKKKAEPRAMNARERLFVVEYLKDLNATQAAIRAGYSEKTARQQGTRLLSKAVIAEAIATGVAKRSERVKLDADFLLQRLADELFADIADIYNDDGSLKPIREWPLVWRTGLVAGIEVEEIWEGQGEERAQVGVLRKVKISDRVKRLDLFGKHVDVQAWKERREIGVDQPLKELLREISGNSIRPREDAGNA